MLRNAAKCCNIPLYAAKFFTEQAYLDILGLMASLYKQTTSKFWWIKYRNPETGTILRESTRYRFGIGAETRKALELVAERTLKERQAPAGNPGRWDTWVADYIREQVSGSTQRGYLISWNTLRMFLHEHEVTAPRELTYTLCTKYVPWRLQSDLRKGKYRAGRNTAIHEIKLLRWIMREAVRRDYAAGNPARELVVKRAPRRLYPDLTDAQLQQIYHAIHTESEPRRTRLERSFAISLLQGVRLNETNVNPMTDVSFDGDFPTIRFLQKGKRIRIKPLHPQLQPLFQRLRAAGATITYAVSDNSDTGRWNSDWTRFFRRHALNEAIPNVCFHSLRVTVENTLREGGIEHRVRETYLTHEHCKDVNAAYDRVKLRELLACHPPLARTWLVL